MTTDSVLQQVAKKLGGEPMPTILDTVETAQQTTANSPESAQASALESTSTQQTPESVQSAPTPPPSPKSALVASVSPSPGIGSSPKSALVASVSPSPGIGSSSPSPKSALVASISPSPETAAQASQPTREDKNVGEIQPQAQEAQQVPPEVSGCRPGRINKSTFSKKPNINQLEKLLKNIKRFEKRFATHVQTKTTELENFSKYIDETDKKDNGDKKDDGTVSKKRIQSMLQQLQAIIDNIQNYVFINYFQKYRHDLGEMSYWNTFLEEIKNVDAITNTLKLELKEVLNGEVNMQHEISTLKTRLKQNQYNQITNIQSSISAYEKRVAEDKDSLSKKDDEIRRLQMELDIRSQQHRSRRGGNLDGMVSYLNNDDIMETLEKVNYSFKRINEIIDTDAPRNASQTHMSEEEKVELQTVLDNIEKENEKLRSITVYFQTTFTEKVGKIRGKLIGMDATDYLDDVDKLEKNTDKSFEKILDYYNNTYNKMDMIFNKNFLFLYIFKVIRFGFIYLSLFLSARIFEEMYIKQVFTQNKDPPHLFIFLGIFLAFDLAFFLFMFMTIMLIKYIFKDPQGTFIIDSYFITKIVVDYILSTILIGIIGLVVCDIIKKKKYFRYKLEGPRAIRASQEIMFAISGICIALPFFLIL